jgi:hypothetical protein
VCEPGESWVVDTWSRFSRPAREGNVVIEATREAESLARLCDLAVGRGKLSPMDEEQRAAT